ncbi:MAG: hypothetical protein QM731_03595 [Chitinophagaceae bacterium]
MKSQLYQVLSILATGGYFIPIVLVLIKRIWYPHSFLLFSLYWLLSGIINLVLLIPGISTNVLGIITVVYNMLDIPMVLGIIYFITNSSAVRKFAKASAIGFGALEIVNACFRGLNSLALKYMLPIGLLLVLIVIIWEIILYLRKLEHGRWERRQIFIYAALLFEYGTYIIIYIFDYHMPEFYQRVDNFIIYYTASVISTIIAVCGFLMKDSNRKMQVI